MEGNLSSKKLNKNYKIIYQKLIIERDVIVAYRCMYKNKS